ncbi:MAG: gliding motility-associated C-terminal domain-containing protein, partial [Bacteroidetes bacterium]|nr:gliding motility-associated C-terminal domain-containing protein [Bacteroidota bacterium]
DPNLSGVACNYVEQGLHLVSILSQGGLPAIIQSYFNPYVFSTNITCIGDTTFFAISDTGLIDSVYWNFGDPASGLADTSTKLSPFHIFTMADTFSVTLYTYSGVMIDTAIQDVVINPLPVVFLGNDTLLCEGDTLTLSAYDPSFTSYLWKYGFTDSAIQLVTADSYWVIVSDGICEGSDTIAVTILPDNFVDLGPDKIYCDGGTFLLDPGAIGSAYLWQDGSTSQTYSVDKPGQYWVEVQNANCFDSDTVNMQVVNPPRVELGDDITLCEGETAELKPSGTSGVSYLWSDNSTGSGLTVSESGQYKVTVDDGRCQTSDSINVEVVELDVEAGPDKHVKKGEAVILEGQVSDYDILWWSPGITAEDSTILTPIVNPVITTRYFLNVQFQDCMEVDSVMVEIFPTSDIAAPRVFIPNGDGKDDYFMVRTYGLKDVKLKIFNRWGEIIYISNDPDGINQGWDGTYKGKQQPSGTYIWLFSGTSIDEENEVMQYGTITLIR